MPVFTFVKMHGAGNDFVLIDDRGLRFPVADRACLAALAAPRTGIACEGLIFVRPSARGDFRMLFFNPDGSEADLCGNGARCVAAFARRIGAAPSDTMVFETRAGLVKAQIGPGDGVKVWMPAPRIHAHAMAVAGRTGDLLTVGVPHFVVPCDDPALCDVAAGGRAVRHDAALAPEGANVDFAAYRPPHAAFMRTYERGVEAESGACGTGAVAVAVAGVAHYGLSWPVRVRTAGGFELVVDSEGQGASACPTLTGPVQTVFSGEVDISPWLGDASALRP